MINTGTTIVTFLMVFLIQLTQNKDAQALHLKLNELVAVIHGASNRLINVEDLSEEEVESLHHHYQKLVELAKAERDLTEFHSIDEAESRHQTKLEERWPGPPMQEGKDRLGQGSPLEASGANGHQESGDSNQDSTPRPLSGDERPKPNNPGEGGGEFAGSQLQGQGGPEAEEVEIAQFLAATQKLRDYFLPIGELPPL